MGLQGIAGIAGGAVGLGAGIATMVLLDSASRPTESIHVDPVEAKGIPDGLSEVRVVDRHHDGSITVEAHTGVGSSNGYGYTYPIEGEPRARITDWKGPSEDDDFRLRSHADGSGTFGVDELERDVPVAERIRDRNLGLAIGGGAALAGGAAIGFGMLAKGSSVAPAAKTFGTALFGVPAAIAGMTMLMWMFDGARTQAGGLADALNPMPRLD